MAGPTPTLRHLQALIAIADGGSFAAAATDLGLDPSSVSRAVAQLESGLGTPLVHRTPAGASLTTAGERTLATARRIVELTEGLAELPDQSAVTGSVVVGAFRSAATLLLPAVVADLRARHPLVDVSVIALREVHSGVAGAVLDGRCDIGLTSLPVPDELRSVPLAEDPYVRVEPADLRGDPERLPMIVWNEACSDRALAWLVDGGRAPARRILVEDDQVVIAMVAEGVGWTVMPAFATRPLPRGARISALAGAPSRTIAAVVRPEALQRAAVAAVLGELAASAALPDAEPLRLDS